MNFEMMIVLVCVGLIIGEQVNEYWLYLIISKEKIVVCVFF